MTGAVRREPEVRALVALLERSRPASTAPLEGFPEGLWERALLGPVREFLRRPGKEFRGRLVELGHGLAGGMDGMMPPELPLLLELLHAGSLIVDDIEDGSQSRRGAPALHRLVGTPLALNTGGWLYFWPFELLSHLPLSPAQRLLAHDRMHACLCRCHEGQALDLAASVVDLEQSAVLPVVSSVTTLKTGSLVGLAMALGGIAAGAPSARLHALDALGQDLGVALQMLDDLSGLANPRRQHKGAEDLRAASPTWPWAWLARDLSEDEYEAHRAQLAALREGGDVKPLIETLSFRLCVTGRRRIQRQVEKALATYRAREGTHPLLTELQAEIAKLERSYVEG